MEFVQNCNPFQTERLLTFSVLDDMVKEIRENDTEQWGIK
jgi:hypothetical protein